EHYSQLLSEYFWKEDSYHVVAGTDSGLLIEHIVNEGIPKNSVYLFVECPEYIELIRPELNDEWQQVLKFCTPDEWEQGFDHNNAAAYFYNDAVMLHYGSAVRAGRNDLYHQLKLRLDFIYKNKVYENSAGLGNRDFISCQLQNVAHNINSGQLLKNAFAGKTCIILGGGPSLDEHLPWVIENQSNLLVIAVSRISRKLQQVGLVPDVVVALDPQQMSYDVSKELYNYPPEVTLLSSYHVIPKLLSQWKGRAAYIGNRLPWESKLNAPEHFTEGPTVVNAALIAAVDMGCSQILLTGADMCYGPDGSTHASASFESEREIDISRDSQWLDTYAGHKAETIIPLILTANYLSKHAHYANEHASKVYNLSKNALKLDHIEYLDINDIELETITIPSKDITKSLLPLVSASDMRRELKLLELEFNKVKKDLSAVNRLATDAIIATGKAFDASSSEHQAISNRQKIEKIERKIKGSYGYLDKLLKTLAFRDFAKILMGGAAITLSEVELAQRNTIYYQAYINGVKELRALLVPAQERLEVLINAYSKSIDMPRIIEYFSQNLEFGIGDIISSYRSNELNDNDKELLLSLKGKLDTYQRGINKAYGRVNHGLGGVAEKIRQLAKDNDHVGLSAVIEFLNKSKEDKTRVEYLSNLGQAFCALINNNHYMAIEFFKKAQEVGLSQWDKEQFVDALVLSEQYDEAMSLLGSLTKSNVGLNRLYGQLLAHHKHFEQAVDAYSKYLEVFKQDIDGWAELGNVFIELAIFESALMAYEFILSLDPNHQVAQDMTQKLRQHFGDKTTG
ncbi:MAG: 6-hydroxymethylpterin diphosphokinase MptE-like protein, partial [Psychrobium sp.]